MGNLPSLIILSTSPPGESFVGVSTAYPMTMRGPAMAWCNRLRTEHSGYVRKATMNKLCHGGKITIGLLSHVGWFMRRHLKVKLCCACLCVPGCKEHATNLGRFPSVVSSRVRLCSKLVLVQ
ncbi:hypothetical protein PspLS_11408 [Pyricularia sp. CBS 133598]|nr:hypothetical protein PspLS_11408 [Pyricularia sp. CBS 133598]